MAKKTRHIVKTSLIIVGEGAHDQAFLCHMKELYDGRETNQSVKIESADGGSPKDIIDVAIKKSKIAAYDKQYVLMDSDIPISNEEQSRAKKKKIIILFSEPICLEGMLLDVLGQKTPSTNQACKDKLHPLLTGKPTEKQSYRVKFPKPVLDTTTKQTIVNLRNVLANKSFIPNKETIAAMEEARKGQLQSAETIDKFSELIKLP